jgi:tetratricopeptide (TPR) repeat protein
LRIPVDVLSLADSVVLLRAMIGPRVDEDLTAAAQLAEQAARLPLALRVAAEVAASRPTTALAELVAELGDEQTRLDALDAGRDDRTRVRVVFSWSYRSLPAEAARLFRLLGLPPATDITPYAAAAMADTSVDHAQLLLDLLARAHLVQPLGPGRYGMHDLLRAYAASVAAGVESEVERQAALTRLFDFYLATTARATETLHPGEGNRRPVVAPAATPMPGVAETTEAAHWLDAELATLTRICTHTVPGWPQLTVQFSAVLYRHLNVSGQPESLTIHAAARDAARSLGDGAAEARSLVFLGIEFGRRGAMTEAERILRDGLEIARRVEDLVTEGMAVGALAIMLWNLGRYGETATMLQQGLALHRRSGDAIGESVVLQNLGVLASMQGRWADAREHLTAALARTEQIGFRDTQVPILCSLSDVALRQGHEDEAAAILDRAITLARTMADRANEAAVRRDLGQLYLRQGRYNEAADVLTQALAVFQPRGMNDFTGEALSRLGEVRYRQGDHLAAVELLERALDMLRAMGEVASQCATLTRLALTRHAMGQPEQARALVTESITLAARPGLRYDEAVARAALSEILSRTQPGPAGEELRRALDLFTELGCPEADQIRARIAAAGPDLVPTP